MRYLIYTVYKISFKVYKISFLTCFFFKLPLPMHSVQKPFRNRHVHER